MVNCHLSSSSNIALVVPVFGLFGFEFERPWAEGTRAVGRRFFTIVTGHDIPVAPGLSVELLSIQDIDVSLQHLWEDQDEVGI